MAMTYQRQREIAQGVLNVLAQRHGAVLGGSMALSEYGLTARRPRNIDIFAAAGDFASSAAPELYDAFTEAGFSVVIGAAYNGGRAVVLQIADPRDGDSVSVSVRLAQAADLAEPVPVEGLGPVMAAEDAAGRAVGDLLHRQSIKHYVDIAHMAAQARGMPSLFPVLWGEGIALEERPLYRAVLRDIADVADEQIRLTAGDERADVTALRAQLLKLSDLVPAGAPEELAANRELILGATALRAEEAAAAFDRIAAAGTIAQGTDAWVMQALMDSRAAFERADREASQAERQAAEAADRAHYGPPMTQEQAEAHHQRFPHVSTEAILRDSAEAAHHAAADYASIAQGQRAWAEFHRAEWGQAAEESSRRRSLTDDERAAEALVRRAVRALHEAGAESVTREAIVDHAASASLSTQRTTTYGTPEQRYPASWKEFDFGAPQVPGPEGPDQQLGL
jgi:hypothetical protein